MPSWIWVLLFILAIAVVAITLLYYSGVLTALAEGDTSARSPSNEPEDLQRRPAAQQPASVARRGVPPPAMAGPVPGGAPGGRASSPRPMMEADAGAPSAPARRSRPPPAAAAGSSDDGEASSGPSGARRSAKPPPAQAAWSSAKDKAGDPET